MFANLRISVNIRFNTLTANKNMASLMLGIRCKTAHTFTHKKYANGLTNWTSSITLLNTNDLKRISLERKIITPQTSMVTPSIDVYAPS